MFIINALGFIFGIATILYCIGLAVTGFMWLVDHDYDEVVTLLSLLVPWFIKRWYRFRKWTKENDAPRFSFRQITTFERTAPKKWKAKKRGEYGYDGQPFWQFYYGYDAVSVKTIIDYWLLIAYFKKRDRKRSARNEETDVARNTAKLLACFRADAENAQAEAEKVMREQEQELQEILTRLTSEETTKKEKYKVVAYK